MRFGILIFLIFTSPPLYSQVEISNKNFNYFDLMEIENNHYQNQLLVSGTLDEFGWNGELFKVNENIFSFNTSITYKRLLPNIGPIWTPVTFEGAPIFPQNGLMIATKVKWYFNHRKFSYAGIKLYGGYLWLNNKNVYDYISMNGPSDTRYNIFWVNNYRYGIDLTVGRKFVNKTISEIYVELGFRRDHTKYQYQCASFCRSGGNDPVITKKEINRIPHLQVILAFDIFTK